MTRRQCAGNDGTLLWKEKLCYPCAPKARSFVPCLHPVCWLRATARVAGVVLVTGVDACFGDGDTAKLAPRNRSGRWRECLERRETVDRRGGRWATWARVAAAWGQ